MIRTPSLVPRPAPLVAAVLATAILVAGASWAIVSASRGAVATALDGPPPAAPAALHTGEARTPSAGGSIGEADGLLPDGATAFDRYPAVSGLDADLRAALQAATRDAAAEGVGIRINSGWRSAAYQDALLADAVADYGSAAEAARWVATASTSLHVRGAAVDVGGAGADAWLAGEGWRYGLCQVYDNEPWHVELRPDAVRSGCPTTYGDPTADPRLAP